MKRVFKPSTRRRHAKVVQPAAIKYEPAHAKPRLSDTCLKLRKTDLKFFVDFASREVRSLWWTITSLLSWICCRISKTRILTGIRCDKCMFPFWLPTAVTHRLSAIISFQRWRRCHLLRRLRLHVQRNLRDVRDWPNGENQLLQCLRQLSGDWRRPRPPS